MEGPAEEQQQGIDRSDKEIRDEGRAPDPQAEAYRQASKRIRARLDFQKHLWSYLLVNGFLWAIYFMTLNPAHQTFWPIWSTVFWGIGVLAQWWNLSRRQDDRQRRMVDEEMRRRNHF